MFTLINSLIFTAVSILIFSYFYIRKLPYCKLILRVMFIVTAVPYLTLCLVPSLADLLPPAIWGHMAIPTLIIPVTLLFLVLINEIKPGLRRTCYATFILCVGFYVIYTRVDILLTDYDALKTTIDSNGTCLQSNGYNCGPASLVTFARLYGKETSEKDAARWCRTANATGTNEHLMLAYLNEVVFGTEKAKIIRDKKQAPRPPYIQQIAISDSVNHWVVVTGRKGKSLDVLNPLFGYVEEDFDQFQKRATGVYLIAQ